MELVFSNARSYNHESSEIYQDALVLLNTFNASAPSPDQQDVEVGGVTSDAIVKVLQRDECLAAIQVGFYPPFLRSSIGKCRNCPFFRAF